MRILGFEKKWPKLESDFFSTFRFERKDKDWGLNEFVQIVIKPRSKDREEMGIAKIVRKEPRRIFPPKARFSPDEPQINEPQISDGEAIADGFPGIKAMQLWMWDRYKRRLFDEPMNKLTLVWLKPFKGHKLP